MSLNPPVESSPAARNTGVEKLSLPDRLIAAVVSAIGYIFVMLVGRTLRIVRVGVDDGNPSPLGARRKAFVFWHGKLLTLSCTERNKPICVLVSRHRDGESIARALERLGFSTVRGSSTEGGMEGLFEMCTKAKEGWDLAITPDGPKGPRHRAQPGVLYLAQRAGVSIVPISCFTASRIALHTWDGLEIPLPFSRVVVMHGAPLEIPREPGALDVEEHTLMLERALVRAGEEARRYFVSAATGQA